MNNIIVIAPHPDDETLGCGGTLLKHKNRGDQVHWLIGTHISEKMGFEATRIEKRQVEIMQVAQKYKFDSIHHLNLPTTLLDTVPMERIVKAISEVFEQVKPQTLYIPYRGDIHTDHAVIFDAVLSCTKWFRHPYVKEILVYETLSETDFGINPDINSFRPNVFVNISDYLHKKLKIMELYQSEIGQFPFPRSKEAMKSLAYVRGAASGYQAAESFMLLKARWD